MIPFHRPQTAALSLREIVTLPIVTAPQGWVMLAPFALVGLAMRYL